MKLPAKKSTSCRQLTKVCLFISFGVAALGAACATNRYVGSIGRDGSYTNRGYGFSLRLGESGLRERWHLVDPRDADADARFPRPVEMNEPLDVDGDGEFEITERRKFMKPTLLMVSKTSTLTTMRLDVRILSPRYAKTSLDRLLRKTLAQKKNPQVWESARMSLVRTTTVSPSFPARVVLVRPNVAVGVLEDRAIALVDHRDFAGEEGVRRRQLVLVVLRSTGSDCEAEILDFRKLLNVLVLAKKAGTEIRGEQW